MNSDLLTVQVRGRPPIGPLPLEELRDRLQTDPAPDDATLIIHTRLGDQVTLLGRHPILRSSRLQPQDSVVCPHCETTQPTSTPGERKCVRCGTKLLLSEKFEATLGSDPKLPWNLTFIGLLGIFVFAKIYPNERAFALSLATTFGVPFILMIRQGVMYSRGGGKITAHEAPLLYAFVLTILGSFTLVGLLLLILPSK